MHFNTKMLLFACAVVGVALGTVVMQWSWLSAANDLLVWGTLAAAVVAVSTSDPRFRQWMAEFVRSLDELRNYRSQRTATVRWHNAPLTALP